MPVLSRLLVVSAVAAGLLAASAADARPRRAAAPQSLPRLETAVELRDRALKGTIAYQIVEDITKYGPRLAGTDAERAAAERGVRTLNGLGFANVRLEPFPLQVWTRGVERGWILTPSPQPIVVTSLGGSIATPPQGVEAEAAIFDTWQAFLAAPEGSLAGKIAVVLQPTPRAPDGSGYGANTPMRSNGPHEAAKRGAVAFLMRSLGTHDHRFPHTGATRMTEPTVPGFAMSPPDSAQIERLAKAGPIRLRLLSTAPLPVQGRSQNVIAEVVGREKPEEVIVVGGHLDSWDLGTGAIDDAAGIAITTAAAKLIADLPVRPRRTIRVVWWGAEEVSQPAPVTSLPGAKAYAEQHAAAMDRHVIASESDFGAGPIYAFNLPAGWAESALKAEALEVLAPMGIRFDAPAATGGGPDTGPLVARGVPVFRLFQDGRDYFDTHHTPDDVIERIDPKNLDQNVAAWAVMLWLIAESDADFRRPAPTAAPAASN